MSNCTKRSFQMEFWKGNILLYSALCWFFFWQFSCCISKWSAFLLVYVYLWLLALFFRFTKVVKKALNSGETFLDVLSTQQPRLENVAKKCHMKFWNLRKRMQKAAPKGVFKLEIFNILGSFSPNCVFNNKISD